MANHADDQVSGAAPRGLAAAAQLAATAQPLHRRILARGIQVLGIGTFYLVINPLITTLGTLSIGAGLAFTFTNGITTPLKDLSTGIWGSTAFAGITYDIVALLALSLVSFLVLRYTVFGRAVYAIGGNREA